MSTTNTLPASTHLIIDFDSTFVKVESLDILCNIVQKNNPNRQHILAEIVRITNLGMSGALSIKDSLTQRIQLLNAHKTHITALIESLKTEISTSFQRHADFIRQNADQIYIISNGFVDFIAPVVADFGIDATHVFGNDFVYDKDDNIVGINLDNALSSNNGKVKVVQSLNLKGKIMVIGDGYNDYEIKKSGVADTFFAFTENIKRPNVIEKADEVINEFDEFLIRLKQHE